MRARHAPRASRWRRFLVAGLTVVVLSLVVSSCLAYRLVRNVDRVDGAFAGLADRPPEEAPDALDVLVASTRMVTLLHIDADRQAAWLIWLPPGTPPEVGAVERLTGVRVDHVAFLDWTAFRELEARASPFWPPFNTTGVRSCAELAHRQQRYLRMLMDASLHQEMRTHPTMLYDFLETVSRHLTIDREWSDWELTRLVISLRGLRSANIHYLSAARGSRAPAFWSAVAHDRLDEWRLSPGSADSPIPGRSRRNGPPTVPLLPMVATSAPRADDRQRTSSGNPRTKGGSTCQQPS